MQGVTIKFILARPMGASNIILPLMMICIPSDSLEKYMLSSSQLFYTTFFIGKGTFTERKYGLMKVPPPMM